MKNKILHLTSYAFIIIAGIIFGIYIISKIDGNNNQITLYGNVDIRQADLGFRVYGRVEKLFFDEGDEIKKGDLMAVLDQIPYKEAVANAEAKMKEAYAVYQKTKAHFEKRFKVNSEAISKEDYDNALFDLKTAKSSFEAAKASLDSALTNLTDTQIFAPTEGTILTRIREPGTVVNIGEPIYTLSVKEPVWVRAYIDEPNLGKVYPGMPANIYTDSQTGIAYKGHVGFISPVAEFTPKTVETLKLRTDLVYRLRVYLENPDKWVRQGMPVTIELQEKNR